MSKKPTTHLNDDVKNGGGENGSGPSIGFFFEYRMNNGREKSYKIKIIDYTTKTAPENLGKRKEEKTHQRKKVMKSIRIKFWVFND